MPFLYQPVNVIDVDDFVVDLLSPLECPRRKVPARLLKEKGHKKESLTINTAEKFAVNLDVKPFKPEELKVNLEGRTLVIEGEHEHSDEHGSFKRTFCRRFALPSDVDLSEIKSSLQDHKLMIEVPRNTVKSIPIEIHKIDSAPAKEQIEDEQPSRPKTPEGSVEVEME